MKKSTPHPLPPTPSPECFYDTFETMLALLVIQLFLETLCKTLTKIDRGGNEFLRYGRMTSYIGSVRSSHFSKHIHDFIARV